MIQTLTCRMEIASRYGLNAAIFMHHIVHWTLKNESEGKHFYDGRYWAYASYDGLVRWFAPLWSIQQIKRIVSKCKDAGILMVGNYNESPTDRTNWYSPSDEILELYAVKPYRADMVRNRTMESSISIATSSEIEPCNNVNINNKINTPPKAPQRGRQRREPKKAPDWEPERFAAFWAYYPRGESKQQAIAAWDKLQPSSELIDEMARALKRQMQTDEWQRGIGIPHASTWLNQRRWEDEQRAPQPPADEGSLPLWT